MGLRSWLTRLRRWLRADSARTVPTPSTRLLVEELENRRVPAAAVADTYLAALYQGFLGRSLDQNGLIFWGGRLRAGATREQVASAILDSPEAHGRQLQILYQNFLGRPLDTPGLQFWGRVFEQQNATYEQVKAGILGSPEFFLRAANNDNLAFLDSIYRSQLNRPLDSVGAVFWFGRLATGLSRESAVAQILQSDEANRVKMIGIYQEVLARPLDPAGDAFWVGNVLHSGRPLEDAIAGVAGSGEFLSQLSASLLRSGQIDANVAADTFFREGSRFDAIVPTVEILARNFITDQRINTLSTSVPFATVTTLAILPPTGTLATGGLTTLVTTTPVQTSVSPTSTALTGFTSGLNSGFMSPFGSTITAFPSFFA